MSWTYAGLFSGLGMLEYACEQLGGEPAFMCESDPFCQRVLRRRFPGVPLIEDVHDVRGAQYAGLIDGLVFGFPCQDVSSAGLQLGIRAARSGLWSEGFRVISEMRPKFVLIENVANLRNKGLDVVLYDLDLIGYCAEWDIISAAAAGAPHLRERIWIVARPKELATIPVFGEVACVKRTGERKIFSLVGKKPRAGRMGEELHELVPLAPRKTKRKDGWSYWVGVNIFDNQQTSRFGSALVPTPCANDDNKSPEGHMRMKQTKMPGGPRNSITSLQVLARNGFRQANGALWGTPNAHPRTHTPRRVDHGEQLANQIDEVERRERLWPTLHGTPREEYERRQGPSGNELGRKINEEERRMWPPTTTTDAKAARNETAGPSDPDSKHHSGTTLLDALIKDGDAHRVQGTVDTGAGSDSIVEVVASRGIGESLGLSSTRVAEAGSWGRPASLFPTPSAANSCQGPGNSGREGGENLVTRINGSLNPTWVCWLMGMPLWWSDPRVHNAFVTQTCWDEEPLHVAPRVATGVVLRTQQLKALGNSVVWQCAFYVLARALASMPEVLHADESVAA